MESKISKAMHCVLSGTAAAAIALSMIASTADAQGLFGGNKGSTSENILQLSGLIRMVANTG